MTEQRFGEHYIEYVLGTLGEPQSREFEDHLVECSECREKLVELEEVLHSLPHALPQSTPAPSVKEALLEEISKTHGSVEHKGSWWRAAAIAASILLILGAAVLLRFYQVSYQKDLTISSLQAEVERLRIANQDLNIKVNELARPDLKFINLVGLTNYESVAGSVFVQTEEERATVFLHNLPALSEDQDFQLWVIEKDKAPHPSTVFQSLGQVTELQLNLPAGVVALQAFALTIEPKGGSPQPTGSMVVLGRL